MRRPHAAAAAVLLLWVAVLTVVFHGLGFGSSVKPSSASVSSFPRKVLLAVAVTSLAASPSAGAGDHRPHHHHHRHHQHHQHHQHHHHQQQQHHDQHHHDHWNRQGLPPSAGHQQHYDQIHHAYWNRQGIPPSAAGEGEEVDPRYGVQKRLVPTGPNPLHH